MEFLGPQVKFRFERETGTITHYYDYAIDGRDVLGYVSVDVLSIKNSDVISSLDDFFIDKQTLRPKPTMIFLRTYPEYRGRGIAGELILHANEYFKKTIGMPLYSGIRFLDNESKVEIYGKDSKALRVFEKLVACGKAERFLQDGQIRYVCL